MTNFKNHTLKFFYFITVKHKIKKQVYFVIKISILKLPFKATINCLEVKTV